MAAVNRCKPDLAGFVIVPGRKRYVSPAEVASLRKALDPGVRAVGVFVDEEISVVAELLTGGIIDIAQLHGNESEEYIRDLRAAIKKANDVRAAAADGCSNRAKQTKKDLRKCEEPQDVGKVRIIKAFGIRNEEDVERAEKSSADLILLDTPGGGSGSAFDWEVLKKVQRPYILAGGLNCSNVGEAVTWLRPYGVDVSSGIETDGVKDEVKMREFILNVRGE